MTFTPEVMWGGGGKKKKLRHISCMNHKWHTDEIVNRKHCRVSKSYLWLKLPLENKVKTKKLQLY